MDRTNATAARYAFEGRCMSVQSAIIRKNLHDELVTLLRNMIIEGELWPGSRISDLRLCTRFGVSRTPLRGALKVLSAEGLVRILPNKGATVVRVTHKEVEEAVPILGTLEALAGELACARIDKERLDRIRSTQRQMAEHFRRGESRPYYELSRALYEAIFEVADNKTLSEAYSILQGRLNSLLLISPKSPPQWAAMVEDHEQMLAALEAGDGARFAQIARGHIRHKAEVMHMALDMLEAEAANVTDRHEQTDHCPVNATQNAHQRAKNARWCVEPNSVEMEQAHKLLREQLASGPKPGSLIKALAAAAAIPEDALVATADVLGVRTQRGQWWLPG